jgi:hypothetical protein
MWVRALDRQGRQHLVGRVPETTADVIGTTESTCLRGGRGGTTVAIAPFYKVYSMAWDWIARQSRYPEVAAAAGFDPDGRGVGNKIVSAAAACDGGGRAAWGQERPGWSSRVSTAS